MSKSSRQQSPAIHAGWRGHPARELQDTGETPASPRGPSGRVTDRVLSYHEARQYIAEGDLLLFRRRGLISIAGRGVHSHAAKASWWDGELFCLETRELRGARAVTLSSQVEEHPGQIDVFETNPDRRWMEYDRRGASRFLRRLAGSPYGWFNLVGTALMHLPWVRLFVRANTDDTACNRHPPFCSQAVAMAERLGGHVDPVPHLADRLTEPADLARSPFYRYRFTLQWNEKKGPQINTDQHG
ncbi:MAG: hypothetical protein JW818_03050 [Pirellulales bacterium]|nr:hypothetical protein [Pirellulales bacterium]